MTLKIPCEVYSRVVGYLRPKSAYSIGALKQANDRKMYDISKITVPVTKGDQ